MAILPRSSLSSLVLVVLSFVASLPALAAPGAVERLTITRFPGGNSEYRRVVVQPDGKAIFAGTARMGTMQFSATRYNADGTLDNAFGTGGTLIEPVGPGDSEAWAAALQPDGKLVMAGWTQGGFNHRFAVARFDANGGFDPLFSGGAVDTAFGDFEAEARAVVVQPDGKIVAGGYAIAGPGRRVFALARYNTDGTLDASFGSGGRVTRAPAVSDEIIHALALQPDGKIIAAGDAGAHILVLRYNTNGSPDTTWGGGSLYFPNIANGRDIAIRNDGKVLIVGTAPDGAAFRMAIARATADGNVDTGYGASGVVKVTTGRDTFGFGIVIEPDHDNRVTISGRGETSPGQGADAVARFLSNGNPDTTFGAGGLSINRIAMSDTGYGLARRGDGYLIAARGDQRTAELAYDSLALALDVTGFHDTTFNGTGYDLRDLGGRRAHARASVLQPDGKLLVAGIVANEAQLGGQSGVVARYLPDNTLDTSFGFGRGYTLYNGGAKAIALAADGKIVTGGYANVTGGSLPGFARMNPDGSLDSSFGTGGVAIISPDGSGLQDVNAIALQADGRIVGGGYSLSGASSVNSVFFRITASGNLDSTFSGDGRAVIPLGTGVNLVNAIAVQPDGRIVAAGLAGARLALARLDTDGSLDPSFGSGGIVTTQATPGESEATAMTLLSDGRILVAGRGSDGSADNFVLARYLASGTLDGSFGAGGVVASDFGNQDRAFALALLANGQVVAAGTTGGLFAVARYSASGALDTSFGTAGLSAFVVNAGSDLAHAVTVGADGKLHVSGSGSGLFATARLSNELSTPAPNMADLALTQTASPNPASPGGNVTFTLLVSNGGPQAANGVTLTDTLPAGATFISASTGCSHVSGTVTCALGSIASGSSAQAQVVVRPATAGSITNSASVAATEADPSSANNSSALTVAVNASPADTPRLGNISTRGQVLTGNDVMIGGFVIGGSANKTVVVRARGPSLAAFGISNPLANPVLQVVRSSDQAPVASNDDWGSAANAAEISASGFAPSNSLEAAVLISLPPGAYTAIVAGAGGGTGVGIVEIFEVDHPEVPLSNVSTRGLVGTANDVLIGGFVVQGAGPQTVIIRARGPSLAPFGIANALANPQLQLVRSSDQSAVASNDDWGTAPNAAAIAASGFAPSNPQESAIMVTLDPGAYTAIVSGVGGGTGVGIVEVFKQ